MAAAEPVTRTTDYDNVHIRVSDPEQAASWYVSALGAKLSVPPAPGTAQVTFGGNVITITKGNSVETSVGTLIDHIGLSFKDVAAAVRTAEAAGAGVTTTPRESPGIFKYTFIEDALGRPHRDGRGPRTSGLPSWSLAGEGSGRDLLSSGYQQQFGGERAKLRGKVDGVRFNGVWIFAMSSGADAPAPATAIMLIALRANDVDAALKVLNDNGIKTAAEPGICRRFATRSSRTRTVSESNL